MFQCGDVMGAIPFLGSLGGSRSTRVYHVEGNVGVGKTECVELVAETLREKGLRVAVIAEDVSRWVEEGYLSECRSDAGREVIGAFGVFDDCLRRHRELVDAAARFDVVFVERHPSTTLRVFDPPPPVKRLFERAGRLIPNFLDVPRETVYLKTSAHACHERVKRRGREGEKSLDEGAFDIWHEKHEDMMKEREAMGGKVYTFDAFGASATQLAPAVVKCIAE
jgi:thymidylate kinase